MGDSADTFTCEGCGKSIPKQNASLHQAICRKHVFRCGTCGVQISLSEKEEHEETHRVETCTLCGHEYPAAEIRKHVSEDCPSRILCCRFCGVDFAAIEMPEHETRCGNRTEYCENCGKYIKLRDLEEHTPICESVPAVQSHDELSHVPCEICDQMIPVAEFEAHEAQCIEAAYQAQQQLLNMLNPDRAIAAQEAQLSPRSQQQQSQSQQLGALASEPQTQPRSARQGQGQAGYDLNERLAAEMLGLEIARSPLAPRIPQTNSTIRSSTVQQQQQQGLPSDFLATPPASQPRSDEHLELVPCDVCNQMIPFDSYASHNCVRRITTALQQPSVHPPHNSAPSSRPPRNVRRPSTVADQENALQDYEQLARRHHNEIYDTETPIYHNGSVYGTPPHSPTTVPPSSVGDDSTMIPCEICGNSFPFGQISIHEESCLERRLGGLTQVLLGGMAMGGPVQQPLPLSIPPQQRGMYVDNATSLYGSGVSPHGTVSQPYVSPRHTPTRGGFSEPVMAIAVDPREAQRQHAVGVPVDQYDNSVSIHAHSQQPMGYGGSRDYWQEQQHPQQGRPMHPYEAGGGGDEFYPDYEEQSHPRSAPSTSHSIPQPSSSSSQPTTTKPEKKSIGRRLKSWFRKLVQ